MKAFSLILALFIMTLSVFPCADDCDMEDEIAQLEHNHADHDEDHESEDGCTPFCRCQCFAGTAIIIDLQQSVEELPTCKEFEKSSHYKGFTSSETAHSIWHPPKA